MSKVGPGLTRSSSALCLKDVKSVRKTDSTVSIEGWLSPREGDALSGSSCVGFDEELDIIDATARDIEMNDRPSSPLPQRLDAEKLAFHARQLRRMMVELVETERAYLKDLDVLVEHIMKPMTEKRDFMTGERLVSDEQIQVIFSNIRQLPAVNEELLRRFEEEEKFIPAEGEQQRIGPSRLAECSASASGDTETAPPREGDGSERRAPRFGKVFLELSDYLRMYTQYCANQPHSLALVEELCKDAQFEALLFEKRDLVEECRMLDLKAFLIKPIQRMCKYPLFLRDMLKHMQVDHDDHEDLNQAYDKITAVVADINEKKKKIESSTELAKLSSSIYVGKKKRMFKVMERSRQIVKIEDFKKITTSKKPFKGRVVVCNDVIMILKPKKSSKQQKWEYVMHFDMATLIIRDVDVPPVFSLTCVSHRGKAPIVLIEAENTAAREQWMDMLQDLVEEITAQEMRRKAQNRKSCKF